MAFVPKAVSKDYRYDWQYLANLTRSSTLRSSSLIVSVMPIVIELSNVFTIEFKISPSLWLTWASAVIYIFGWVLFQFRCPPIVKDFRHYGEYQLRENSHRWIIWEFYNNRFILDGWQNIVEETTDKGLTVAVDNRLDFSIYRCSPIFRSTSSNQPVDALEPENLNRDIYMPILNSGQRLILLLQETDPDLKEKEKELFWILFSQSAKERNVSRYAVWVLFWIAGGVFLSSVVWNAARVISGGFVGS